MKATLRPALVLLLIFVVLTGLLFPLAVTTVGQAAFPHQAGGSLIVAEGRVVGSELIGQEFRQAGFFHPRPSAAGAGYDAGNSGGTNLGPTSRKLLEGAPDGTFAGVKQLAEGYRRENGLSADVLIPADAVTRSGSGLDPHISLRDAELQARRVAQATGIPVEEVKTQIRSAIDPAFAGVFGEPAVNVLRLNRSLVPRTSR